MRNYRGLIFPDLNETFVADLILQRTGEFLKLPQANEVLNEWFRTGDKSRLAEHLSNLKKTDWFIDQTLAIAEREAEEMISLLTALKLKDLVSIGPGNGIVEAIIALNSNLNSLLLIDIESSVEHEHGFKPKGSGYASLENAQRLIERNSKDHINIQTCNPTREKLPVFKFSGAISLLSMGFHYPINDYAAWLTENGTIDSQIIFDKRKGVQDNGFNKLLEHYKVRVITENIKSARLLLRRK